MTESALRPGDWCDRYTVVRRIASGGMGEVYEAVHGFTRRTVALKCLKLLHSDNRDLAERMRMEAVVLSRIRHPNIVTVFDAGVTPGGVVWIAMDLLVGKTLRELLGEAGRLPVTYALRLACAIAEGVGAAHAERVVHRDIKPENVFVTSQGEVKVLDLGTAKFYGYGLRPTDNLRTLGTPAYMAPEHLQGHPVDARTDVYALGLVLYEMLAGHHAFASGSNASMPNDFELTRAQLFAIPRPLPELIAGFPAHVWSVVEATVAKNPAQRYPSMADLSRGMRAALERCEEEERRSTLLPVAVAATRGRRRPAAPRRRARLSLGRGIALGLMLGAGTAVLGTVSGMMRARPRVSSGNESPPIVVSAAALAAPASLPVAPPIEPPKDPPPATSSLPARAVPSGRRAPAAPRRPPAPVKSAPSPQVEPAFQL